MELPDWKYWLYRRFGIDMDRFDLREVLNDNPIFVYAGAGVLVLFALTMVVCQFAGGSSINRSSTFTQVYYDTVGQQMRLIEYTVKDGISKPNESDFDGLYQAALFSCEDKEPGLVKEGMSLEELKQAGLFIGYLQKEDPNIPEDQRMFEAGMMIKPLNGDRWYSMVQMESRRVYELPYKRCPEARPYIPF